MTRSILTGLLGLLSIAAVGALPLACQSGGIGDPCIPEDEYNADFGGFKVTEENVESRSFQCSTRICLVNHFQGRVTCPFGQKAPTPCDGVGKDAKCDVTAGEKCVEAGTNAPDCVPRASCSTAKDCPNGGACNAGLCPETCSGGLACDKTRKVCGCTAINNNDVTGAKCVLSNPDDANSISVLKTFVCHKANDCQSAASDPMADAKKGCCVPGTDTPTTTSVCGQCAGDSSAKSPRSADQAVYCSCRCGVADGAVEEPDFNFCACPTGFSCEQVRPDVGIGDPLLTGKYCIKDGTKFANNKLTECKTVVGHIDATCQGQN